MEISSNSDDDIILTDETDSKKLEQLENETINEDDFLLIKISCKNVRFARNHKDMELNVLYLKKVTGTNKF